MDAVDVPEGPVAGALNQRVQNGRIGQRGRDLGPVSRRRMSAWAESRAWCLTLIRDWPRAIIADVSEEECRTVRMVDTDEYPNTLTGEYMPRDTHAGAAPVWWGVRPYMSPRRTDDHLSTRSFNTISLPDAPLARAPGVGRLARTTHPMFNRVARGADRIAAGTLANSAALLA